MPMLNTQRPRSYSDVTFCSFMQNGAIISLMSHKSRCRQRFSHFNFRILLLLPSLLRQLLLLILLLLLLLMLFLPLLFCSCRFWSSCCCCFCCCCFCCLRFLLLRLMLPLRFLFSMCTYSTKCIVVVLCSGCCCWWWLWCRRPFCCCRCCSLPCFCIYMSFKLTNKTCD